VNSAHVVPCVAEMLPSCKRKSHIRDSQGFGKIITASAGHHEPGNLVSVEFREIAVNCAIAAKDQSSRHIFCCIQVGDDSQFRAYLLKWPYCSFWNIRMEQSHCLHDEDSAAWRGTPQTKSAVRKSNLLQRCCCTLRSIFSAKSHGPPL